MPIDARGHGHTWNILIKLVLRQLVHNQEVKLLHVEELAVAEAPCAIALVTIQAEETVFVARNYSRAPAALHRLITCVRTNHALARLELRALLIFVDAVLAHAETKAFLWSSQSGQMLRQVVNNFLAMRFDSFSVHISQAFVIREFGSAKVALANLALNDDLWAVSLDMLEQLCSSHVLELFLVADVAAELGALVHWMVLQISHSFPDNNLTAIFPALVWELTEVNAIAKNFIDWLHEISSFLAVGAAHFEAWRDISSLQGSLFCVNLGSILFSLSWWHARKLLFG